MLKGAIARRYAGAIFDLALKQNTLDRTLEDIQGIAQLFKQRRLAYLLSEPKISAKRKETAIRQALASQVLPASLNLALLVVQRNLVEIMPNLAAELQQLVLDYKNQAVAQVTTATAMDEKQLSVIKQALERQTGKQIILETRVDPSILGGVVARVGDQIIDGSVRYRLAALQQRLLNSAATADIDFLDDLPAEEQQGHATTTDTPSIAYPSVPGASSVTERA
ncbi:MAG TPA: ATP synthase F1 subunit delta [Ktedonobacteraceae bacterium]|jgi:F-type H+-transporting ATPase subunit delta|nr:ATP synthase F1 subunit delta [Ktedonobacteraceae bacterium]